MLGICIKTEDYIIYGEMGWVRLDEFFFGGGGTSTNRRTLKMSHFSSIRVNFISVNFSENPIKKVSIFLPFCIEELRFHPRLLRLGPHKSATVTIKIQ